MSIELLPLVSGFTTGLALGAMFFGGLALTVRRVPHTAHPARLLLLSFLGRTALVGAGLMLVGRGDWRVMAAALVGIAMMRFVFVTLLRSKPAAAGANNSNGAAS